MSDFGIEAGRLSSPLDDSCLMVSVQFPVTLGRGALDIGVFICLLLLPRKPLGWGWQMLSNFANRGFIPHASDWCNMGSEVHCRNSGHHVVVTRWLY